MFIILSIFSIPFISLCFPGLSLSLFILAAIPLYNISFTKVLLPDPETPVIHTNFPKGILAVKFFKLFSLALATYINLPFPSLVSSGIIICFFPLKYCPVIESSFCNISSKVPCATIFPP